MAALPFYQYRKVVQKPSLKQYNLNPETIGEHVRKARIERGLSQGHVALQLGACEDTITYWENGRSNPQMKFYPAIIQFLGYYPFDHETETYAGKLRQIRYYKGFDFGRCAAFFHVSVDAAKRWESGKPIANKRFCSVIQHVWETLTQTE